MSWMTWKSTSRKNPKENERTGQWLLFDLGVFLSFIGMLLSSSAFRLGRWPCWGNTFVVPHSLVVVTPLGAYSLG
jgi:hypothetical protein